jgi:hypothetical protein
MRHSLGTTRSITVNGGRMNLGRIPSTSIESERQSVAQLPHQEKYVQGR